MWRIGHYVRVRSAGFPFQLIEPLRQARAAESLDADETDLGAIGSTLEAIVFQHPEFFRTRVGSLRKRVHRACEELLPIMEDAAAAAPGRDEEWDRWVAEWNEAISDRANRLEEIEQLYDRELEAGRQYLWELVSKHQLCDALYFSSPQAAATLQHAAREELPARKSRIRAHEATAALFAQRFCTKNDSISYYGPIFWATLQPQAEMLRVEPGPQLIKARYVSLEHWAADALATAVASDPEVAPYLVPVLRPGYRAGGEGVHRADGSTVELSIQELEVIRLAGAGTRSRDLPEQPLRRLLSRGILAAGFSIPTVRNSERLLVEAVEALPEACQGRARWSKTLHELLEQLESFARIPHADHPRRVASFEALEHRFEEIAGRHSRRAAGQLYAGRSILYEDCIRDFDAFELGGTLIRELRALDPLLDLCEWTARTLGGREHQRYLSVYRTLGQPGEPVPLYRLYEAADKSDGRVLSELNARKVEAELERAWAAYLHHLDPEWRTRPEILLPENAFAAVQGTLPAAPILPDRGALVHSPDLMIAARDLDDINAGNFEIVMGELHKGVFATAIPWACPLMPDPSLLEQDFLEWAGGPLMDLAPPDGNRAATNWPDFDCHLQVAHDGGVPNVSAHRLIPISELEVFEDQQGLLWTRRRGKAEQFFLLEVMRREIVRHLLSIDPLTISGARAPRVRWGRFILARRKWRFDPEEFPPIEGHGFALFRSMREWAEQHGLPERVFVRVPQEPKPFYVDFANTFLLEVLAKQLRVADHASFSEMSPDADALWLRRGSERFTCELRLTMYRARKEE